MSDYLLEQLAEVRRELADLRSQRVTNKGATVTAADSVTSTFTVDMPGGQVLAGMQAPPQFLPAVGDEVSLRLTGATPVYEPARIAENAVGPVELSEDAVDGKTIVGVVLKTADSGQRVWVYQRDGEGVVEMYSGDDDTEPATLTTAVIDGRKAVRLAFGSDPESGEPGPVVLLRMTAAGERRAEVYADSVTFEGTVDINTLRLFSPPVELEDAVRLQDLNGAKDTPTYASGWSDFGAGSAGLTAGKVGNRVTVYGLVQNAGAYSTPSLIATLPVGFRPLTIVRSVGIRDNNAHRFDFDAAGQVISIPAGPITAGSYHAVMATFDVTV